MLTTRCRRTASGAAPIAYCSYVSARASSLHRSLPRHPSSADHLSRPPRIEALGRPTRSVLFPQKKLHPPNNETYLGRGNLYCRVSVGERAGSFLYGGGNAPWEG